MKMRNTTLLLVLLITVPFASMPRVSVQFKGGLNLARMYGEDVDNMTERLDSKPRVGAIGGLGLQIKIIDYILIRPEALFSMKGIVYETKVNDTTFNYKYLYTYIDLPLLTVFSIPVKDFFFPHIFVGPTWSINITARNEFDPDPMHLNKNIKDDTEPLDIGLVMGGGASFKTQQTIITVECRYTLGFRTTDSRDDEFHKKDDTKNGVLSIILSLSPLGQKN